MGENLEDMFGIDRKSWPAGALGAQLGGVVPVSVLQPREPTAATACPLPTANAIRISLQLPARCKAATGAQGRPSPGRWLTDADHGRP